MKPSEKDLKIAKLLRFYTDQSIAENQPFGTIRNNAYVILPASKIDQIAAELEDKTQKEKSLKVFYWQAVDLLSKTYKPPLRALLQALSLEGEQHKALQKACKFLQAGLGAERGLSSIKSDEFPQQFMGAQVKDFIYDTETKNLNLNRYEYECYRQVANAINGRSLFVSNSSRYRSLNSELLQNWQQNKSAVLKKVNRPLLNFPLQQFIDEKAKPLDDKIILINEAINSGENAYLKVKLQQDGSKVWTLPYTKKSEDLNNPFYEKLPPVNIIRVLQFVNQNTQFMQEFTHIKPHYAKSRQDELSIYGCLIANGTNLGIMKMAGLCDCPLSSLETTDKNFIRLATLRAANDVVSNHIAKLSIFRHWNINPNLLHASLDGTKISTERETLLSRYSPKYFGLDKGCVDYLLNANHVPINAMVIGANEHESHFLFDLIYNNTSEIQPDIFSTDTEGSNQLNFLLLHLIEKLYAPRYRSLSTKTESIVSFSSPEQFKDLLIKPQRQLSQKLILNEEDNIQHILASLLMGETKQSNIVAKLSSKQFASRTKQALWEMNAILMTDHLLNSIGDVGFRQSIQAALNRGEAYNQLRRHVERVNGRSIMVPRNCTSE